MWRPLERLQKDAPRDIEEIQRKEGQGSDPVHVSISVTHELQLRHEKAEKGKRGYRHILNATVTAIGTEATTQRAFFRSR